VIRSVELDERRRPRIQLTQREVAPSAPSRRREWILEEMEREFPRGTRVTGTVNSIQDQLGLFVTLAEGLSVLAHKSQIGPRGVATPSQHFKIGQQVQGEIARVGLDRQGRPRIQLAIRDEAIS
jgi:ribosomal protein S1